MQEVVAAIKRNLQVDWTRDHRQDMYAGVQSAVKLGLCKRRIRGEQLQFILNRVMQQAEAGYEDWVKIEYLLEETLDEIEDLLGLEKGCRIEPVETIQVPVFSLKKTA